MTSLKVAFPRAENLNEDLSNMKQEWQQFSREFRYSGGACSEEESV